MARLNELNARFDRQEDSCRSKFERDLQTSREGMREEFERQVQVMRAELSKEYDTRVRAVQVCWFSNPSKRKDG
jgi:hypothetical protein